MLGKLGFYIVNENIIEIQFENGVGKIEFINENIVNFFSPLKYEKHFSRAVEDLKKSKVDFHVINEKNCIEIESSILRIKVYDEFKVDIYDNKGNIICEDYKYKRKPFIRRGNGKIAEGEGIKVEENFRKHKIEIVKKMLGDEYFYGFGEKTGHLNKKGYYYEMWNTDDPKPHVENYTALYKSIPFFITKRNNLSFGIFFDNTFKTYFDMGKENSEYYYFAADDGNLDYYFIYGPSIKEVVIGYTELTGKTPLPQLWTLGYHQSRWSYSPKDRVMEIAKLFREKDIPCDVIHLDIDYMDGFRVFTWDKSAFENHKKMIKDLKNMGFKVVTIIDPGVKKDRGYKIYDDGLKNGYFATDKDGIPYVNEVWPGEALYPDFTDEKVRMWWSENQRIMMEDGIAGIWNDMNEPASFKGPLPDDVQFKNDGRPTNHLEVHNVYGHLMSKATYEGIKKYTNKRPFVITRACFAGTQKYSTIWTGDNHSFWEHLRMAVPMLLNLGLSGMAFSGTDVGGFQFDATGELLSRWVQLGCFTPLFRNHSCMHTRDQEPWAFDKQTEDINRKYIKLRYKLLPYIYDLMYQAEFYGLPVMRPLILHYENDINTFELNDQFLFGENILVAPVLEQGKNVRAVYLPEGRWVDYWTKQIHEGGKYILKEAPLDICPIFIKEGSVIPNYEEQNFVGEKPNNILIIDVYPGSGEYYHYKDDGESFDYRDGKYNLYKISMQIEKILRIDISKEHDGYTDYEKIIFKFNNYDGKVLINSKEYSVKNSILEISMN
ncbi:Alpha-xylosidase [Caloramator mitchellensis]|uniref:Alpha-xylosidase n=1 Tax=Caloramator mitchellensis TaxID=908809 RepID=A0A0R3JUG9_CALMK|nr:glycoside hydrolase family 31 protein [Caloramator mitchellensis]KRQ87200.1 Alpha-xylosidase [Caloramator mitchellensis]